MTPRKTQRNYSRERLLLLLLTVSSSDSSNFFCECSFGIYDDTSATILDLGFLSLSAAVSTLSVSPTLLAASAHHRSARCVLQLRWCRVSTFFENSKKNLKKNGKLTSKVDLCWHTSIIREKMSYTITSSNGDQ